MASGSWLTSRFQTLVNVVTPKIATSLLDKSNKLDLATAENHLIRNEVLEVYRETITDCLSHKVSFSLREGSLGNLLIFVIVSLLP